MQAATYLSLRRAGVHAWPSARAFVRTLEVALWGSRRRTTTCTGTTSSVAGTAARAPGLKLRVVACLRASPATLRRRVASWAVLGAVAVQCWIFPRRARLSCQLSLRAATSPLSSYPRQVPHLVSSSKPRARRQPPARVLKSTQLGEALFEQHDGERRLPSRSMTRAAMTPQRR